ncbi:MAG: ATP synthase F0 subunit B [Kiritimatiellia bacterium]
MEPTEQITEQSVETADNGAVMGFDGQVVLLTWIAFLIAAIVLGKLLWKPILNFIEERETEIKGALEDAATARKSAAEAELTSGKILADAEHQAHAKADALAIASRQHIAEMEAEARALIAEKQKTAELRIAEERIDMIKHLNEQAGGEIASALARMLPGLLTDEQRQSYQDKIAAEVKF